MEKQKIPRRFQSWGFSLLELMVTVALIAILTSIAYGSYVKQTNKSHRTEAKTALLDLAGREERLYATTNSYSNSLSTLGYPTSSTSNGYYTLAISNVTAGPPATFTITATAAGAQARDTDCASFTVDQTGQQTSTGTSSSCW